MGLLLIVVFYFFGGGLPVWLGSFLNWLYFLSVNLALVNMLPVYPLDGGQMVRSFLATRPDWGPRLERVTMGCFLALIGGNLVLSLIRFGLVPL